MLILLKLLFTGCSEGYEDKNGDVPGRGIKGDINDTTTDECAALCNAEAMCCAYEWSPSDKICHLNEECSPTASKYTDYYYCAIKGKCRKNLNCHFKLSWRGRVKNKFQNIFF